MNPNKILVGYLRQYIVKELEKDNPLLKASSKG